MVANEPPIINSEDIYFLTHLGQSELAAAGTSLSRSELELLVLIDGKATVSQVQASAGHLAPGEVIEVLDKLLRSEHIALQQFDLGDFFGASAPGEWKGKMPSNRAIARGVSTLQHDGYIVRIARRPPSVPRLARDRKLTVMVVEDEPQLAEVMRKVLGLAGFVARVAANREQIVAAFRQPPLPDLVLLDVMLPDTDGFNVLAGMRQHPMLREVPVVMVTGTATREAVLSGLRGGANGYITKPFHIEVLVKAVKTVLGIEVSDQKAVPGGILSAAESARRGSQAIPAAHPAATPVAPAPAPAAAPAAASVPPPPAPASASAPAPAEIEAFNPSPGSLLARLREAAQAKLREEQREKGKPDLKEQLVGIVSDAVEKTYQHLKEVVTLLNTVKPAYAKEYALPGLPNFDELKWASVHLDFRTRELSSTLRAFEQVTLQYHLAAKKTLSAVCEIPADEKLKQMLENAKIQFSTERERNNRGVPVATKFVIPCEVKAALQLAGNFETGKLMLKLRNVEHFGTAEFMVSPEAIKKESLDELVQFILGETRRIGSLLPKGV